MEKATISEIKNRLSAYLKKVKAGQSILILDRDQPVARLERVGSSPLSDPVGTAGARRACVRNPDGVYVEIMEDDPLSGAGLAPKRSACPVAVRSVTLTVPDLSRSEGFFSRGLGLV